MRRLAFLVAAAVPVAAVAQSDHNNLDKERPLRFEDAYSIAYRSFEFQNGVRFDTFRGRRPVLNLRSELQWGFAKNRDLSIGWEPFYDGETGRFRTNVAEVSYFETLAREIGNRPAFGYRIDLGFPVEGGRSGVDGRLRAILTKALRQYDRFHANLDVMHATSPAAGNRRTRLGAILGYSTPVGYPVHFDTTLLGEFGIEQGSLTGSGLNTWLGLGIRRQLSSVGVLDVGVQTDLRRADGPSSPFRLTLGYSVNF